MFKKIPENCSLSSSAHFEHEKWEVRNERYAENIRFWKGKGGTRNAVKLNINDTKIEAEASYCTCLYLPVMEESHFESLYIKPKFQNLDYITMLEKIYLHCDVIPDFQKEMGEIIRYSKDSDREDSYLIPVPDDWECIFLPFLITKRLLDAEYLGAGIEADEMDAICMHLPDILHGSRIRELPITRVENKSLAQYKLYDLFSNRNDDKVILDILQNYDAQRHEWYLPQFWISMPKLFELYFFHLFIEAFPGQTLPLYQSRFNSPGRIYPDFLLLNEQCIVDTKYKELKDISSDDVKNMALYSIAKGVREKLCLDGQTTKGIFVYFDIDGHVGLSARLFDKSKKMKGLDNIRAYGVKLPRF